MHASFVSRRYTWYNFFYIINIILYLFDSVYFSYTAYHCIFFKIQYENHCLLSDCSCYFIFNIILMLFGLSHLNICFPLTTFFSFVILFSPSFGLINYFKYPFLSSLGFLVTSIILLLILSVYTSLMMFNLIKLLNFKT